jgi:uncharacterized protein YggE
VEGEIVVRGESEVLVMPDRATVQVVVDGNGASQEEAFEAAAALARAVDDVFDTHSGAFDRVQTTGLVVMPRTKWRKGENLRTGWRASRTSVAEIHALERAGELLALLAGAGGQLSGLTWEIDRGHEAFGEARQAAGRDARERAEQYAAALGVTLGGVAWIAEPGLRSAEARPYQMMAMASRAAGGLQDDAMEVAPEEITVGATVEVGFTIIAG